MLKGHTVDGFLISRGTLVYIPFHAEIEQPKSDPPLPPKFTWTPKKLIIESEHPERCWHRYTDCHTYCESLNRSK